MKLKGLLSFFLALSSVSVHAQITIATTNPTTTFLSGSSGIAFVVQNTNAYPVVLNSVSIYRNTASTSATYTLWYSATSLSGTSTLSSPTYTQIASNSPGNVTANGVSQIFSNLTFTIPANTTYRFAVKSSNRTDYGSSTTGANTFSNGGINVRLGNFQLSGANVGYSGSGANPSLTTTPRYFYGTLVFSPAVPCAGIPTAGTISGPTNACMGQAVSMSLSGQTVATGISYQWRSRAAGSGLQFVDIPSATASTYSSVITESTEYLCRVTCNNSSQSMQTPAHLIALPKAPIGMPDTVCSGNTARLVADTGKTVYKWYAAPVGGTALYTGDTFAISNLTADTAYYLSAIINGCESVRSRVAATIGQPSVVSLPEDTTYCINANAFLNAGHDGYQYLWNTGDSTPVIKAPKFSGKYWVAVTKYCTVIDTINVTVDPLPEINGISYVRNGNEYSFSPAGDFYADSYFWQFGDGATDTGRQVKHKYADANHYNVKLTLTNHCGSTVFALSTPVSVSEINDKTVNVYPNPAGNYVFISLSDKSAKEISIHNSLGVLVKTQTISNYERQELDIANLPTGNYILSVLGAEGEYRKVLQIVK